MSGNSKMRARSSKGEGWEEAGGEFYQESYPGGEQDIFENLQRADAAKIQTLLPSKQARNTTTVKRVRSQNERRHSTYARTMQSRDVHLSMLPDLSENLSNEERTWEEIMQIKSMPVPMAEKRELKTRLQNATKLRLQGLEQLQWRQRKVYHRFRLRLTETLTKLELWYTSMKKIEGNFGTGVVAYFLLLRWLLCLNILISLIVICFVVLPKSLFVDNIVCGNSTVECCAEAYLGKNLTEGNVFLDALQGTGFMEKTLLFYGVYSNKVFGFYVKYLGLIYYNMPLAYVLVPFAWAFVSLVLIVRSAAKGFKERLIANEGQFYLYCNLIFAGWDFCIHNEKSAEIKRKALYNEIRGCLEDARLKEEKLSLTREGVVYLYFKRIVINIFVFVILISCGFLIYLVFNYSINELQTRENVASTTNVTRYDFLSEHQKIFDELYILILEFMPSICIVVLNTIIPVLFQNLIRMESYTPARTIVVSLLRTILLRLSSLGVLLSQIYTNVTAPNRNICSINNDNLVLECWETYAGQQFYKLMLTDFVIQTLLTFFVNYPRAIIARHSKGKFCKLIGEQEFYLPKHVLDIVYTQTIIWMGAFFCPFLPLLGTIYFFLMFYIKRFTCLVNSTPSQVVYRASKSKSLFMSILFVGLILSIIPLAFSIAEIKPSINCGPFRGYSTVWAFMVETFSGLPFLVREVVFFLGTSTFAVPAFAVLLFLLYYYWAVTEANRHMVRVLRSQLVLEGHDKQFLLNRLTAFIRQHQRRCERKNRTSVADSDSIRQSSR